MFVDGGLVSNLPVWAFVSEKKMFERAATGGSVPIFAFTLNATSGEKMHAPKRRSASERRGVWRSLAAGLWWLVTTPVLLAAAAVRWLAVAPFRLVGWLGNLVWRAPFHIADHVRDVIETGIFGSQTVVQSKEEGAPARIAHTLTACCRCRTVSPRARPVPSPARLPGSNADPQSSAAQDTMRPRPPPLWALRAHQLALRVL